MRETGNDPLKKQALADSDVEVVPSRKPPRLRCVRVAGRAVLWTTTTTTMSDLIHREEERRQATALIPFQKFGCKAK